MIELRIDGTTGPMRIKEAMENMLPAMETTFDNWYLSQICKSKIYEVGQYLLKFHIIQAYRARYDGWKNIRTPVNEECQGGLILSGASRSHEIWCPEGFYHQIASKIDHIVNQWPDHCWSLRKWSCQCLPHSVIDWSYTPSRPSTPSVDSCLRLAFPLSQCLCLAWELWYK